MKVTEKLVWGDELKPTKLAIENEIVGRSDIGVFVGYQKRGSCIGVIKKGCRTVRYYHVNFWDKK